MCVSHSDQKKTRNSSFVLYSTYKHEVPRHASANKRSEKKKKGGIPSITKSLLLFWLRGLENGLRDRPHPHVK